MSKEYEQAIHIGRYKNHHPCLLIEKMLCLIDIKTKLDRSPTQHGQIKISNNIRYWQEY